MFFVVRLFKELCCGAAVFLIRLVFAVGRQEVTRRNWAEWIQNIRAIGARPDNTIGANNM